VAVLKNTNMTSFALRWLLRSLLCALPPLPLPLPPPLLLVARVRFTSNVKPVQRRSVLQYALAAASV
jgi:hypothetical protein